MKPVIKSPKEISSITIEKNKLKYKVFMCNESKAKLKNTKALEYIVWGENKNYHKRPSTKSRNQWWSLGSWKISEGVLPCGIGSKFRFFENVPKVFSDKRLYLFYGNKNILKFLNTSIYTMLLELGARTGLGDGLLDLTVYEFQQTLILDLEFKENLDENRDMKSIFEECGIDPKSDTPISQQEPKPLPDRKKLDDIVFDALNLTEEERKEVYRAVCQLVWNRVGKAKSV